MSINSISNNTGYLARSSGSGQSCQQSQSSSSGSTTKSLQGSVTVDFSTLAMLLQAQSGSTGSISQAASSTQSATFSLTAIGGASSSGLPPPPPGMDGSSGTGGTPPFKEMDQALSDLSTALQSGDIDSARKALATFQSLAPKPPDASNDSASTTGTSTDATNSDGTTTASSTSTTTTSSSPLSDKLAALSDALDSGDTDSAQSAYKALMEDIQSHKPDDGMQARQRQHHMGQYMQMATLGSKTSSTASTVSTST